MFSRLFLAIKNPPTADQAAPGDPEDRLGDGVADEHPGESAAGFFGGVIPRLGLQLRHDPVDRIEPAAGEPQVVEVQADPRRLTLTGRGDAIHGAAHRGVSDRSIRRADVFGVHVLTDVRAPRRARPTHCACGNLRGTLYPAVPLSYACHCGRFAAQGNHHERDAGQDHHRGDCFG